LNHGITPRDLATNSVSAPPSVRRPSRISQQATDDNPSRGVRGTALNVAVMTIASAIVATLALPGYAFDPAANADGVAAAESAAQLRATQSQSLQIDLAAGQDATRDQFTATSEEELAAAKAAEAAAAAAEAAAAAAAERRAELASTYQAYSGPTASELVASPRYPNYDLGSIVGVGLQYVGVPYRYGGTTPEGFDCSGFTAYVYAQFGVSLPHSVSRQAAMGTRISRADARPGDLVVLNDHSHIGIYGGSGRILDAPYPGKTVQMRALWTDSYYIVRIGG
jgi:peptidoglycan DL-endopeptidase CwlO